MSNFQMMQALHIPAKTKIVHLVIDGLGGLPANRGQNRAGDGQHTQPRRPGRPLAAWTGRSGWPRDHPGSGPAHLALFGYDPLTYDIGRGVLEALASL